MEALAALFAVGVVLIGGTLVIVLPFVIFGRLGSLRTDLGNVTRRISELETRVEALAKRVVSLRPSEGAAPVAREEPPKERAPEPTLIVPPSPEATVVMRPTAPIPMRPTASIPAPPPQARPAPPVPPRPPAPPSPPTPPKPPFDWESLLGLKGAAWLGGITLFMASLFFAKWTIDQGLMTPPLRIAGLILAGIGALAWAELSLRRGYETTANAVSGAGIATLYVAFFAGHALYQLFSLGVTFFFMALVTIMAGLLAIRYNAIYTAILGLLGGFATPLALSTGVDHPVGLFSYLLLLNLGLLSVAFRQGWHSLVRLGLAATLLIEMGWFFKFMSPEKMGIGLTAFLVLGLLYLLAPASFGKGDEESGLDSATAIGGIVPFIFGLLLAADDTYVRQWALLFGYMGLLDAALIAIALFRGRVALLIAGSLSTALILPLWAGSGLGKTSLWGPVLGAAALTVLLNLTRRIGRILGQDEPQGATVDLSGFIATGGLGLFALVLVGKGLGEPPWAFVFLSIVLFAVLLECAGGGLRFVLRLGGVGLAVLIQIWFFRDLSGGATLVRDLALPLLLPIGLSLYAATALENADGEGGVVGSTLVLMFGLFACIGTSRYGRDPRPIFGAMALADSFLVLSALRAGSVGLLPVALLASSLFVMFWHTTYFQVADFGFALPSYVAFLLAFLALPFLVSRQRWQGRSAQWLTSALSPALFFPVLYWSFVSAWGKAWIGLLPVVLAILSLGALVAARNRFGIPSDPEAARLRLRHLATFAAIGLGFVTLAIPLQLDRQWITVGWALEAFAVWWLYSRRLPHVGLLYLGAGLFAAVGVRLLLNPEVFRYEARSLPIFNWLLYGYGVPAVCCFLGARFVYDSGDERQLGSANRLGKSAAALGLLLVFWLINLEVADFYSAGRYVEFSFERHFARDLTLSVSWGTYALTLLLIGIRRSLKGLRIASLIFLILTVAKVLVYDLATLPGLYRVLSFLGVGVLLIFVSLIYQKFVAPKAETS